MRHSLMGLQNHAILRLRISSMAGEQLGSFIPFSVSIPLLRLLRSWIHGSADEFRLLGIASFSDSFVPLSSSAKQWESNSTVIFRKPCLMMEETDKNRKTPSSSPFSKTRLLLLQNLELGELVLLNLYLPFNFNFLIFFRTLNCLWSPLRNFKIQSPYEQAGYWIQIQVWI